MKIRGDHGDKSYDAFISYRHQGDQEELAESLMNWLEQYRIKDPVTGKQRKLIIFRDESELGIEASLRGKIETALKNSRFLIVFGTQAYLDSEWCMGELNFFRTLPQGSNENILLLLSGDTTEKYRDIHSQIFPVSDSSASENGVVEGKRRPDPRAADIRVDSMENKDKERKAKKKKLQETEHIRLAAKIMGKEYDDVYQRVERRRRHLLLSALFTSIAVLAVISCFLLWALYSRSQSRQRLVGNYLLQAAQCQEEGRLQQALMYYANALNIDKNNSSATSGALLTLQESDWLYCSGSVDASPEPTIPWADLSDYGDLLRVDGKTVELLTFGTDRLLTLYDVRTGLLYQLPRPQNQNVAMNSDELSANPWDYFANPAVYPFQENHAVVKYGGYLYLYEFPPRQDDGIPTGILTDTLDLSQVFTLNEYEGLDWENEMWVSEEGLAVILNGYSAAVMDLKYPCVNAVHTNYDYFITDVSFREDGMSYALIYENSRGIGSGDAGTFAEIYDKYGNLTGITPKITGSVLKYGEFSPDGNRLLLYGISDVQLADGINGRLLCAPLYLREIISAGFENNGDIWVEDDSGIRWRYTAEKFQVPQSTTEMISSEEKQNQGDRSFQLDNGYTLAHDFTGLAILDDDGNEVDSVHDLTVFNQVLVNDSKTFAYLWYKGNPNICRVPLDVRRGKLGKPVVISTMGRLCMQMIELSNGIIVVSSQELLLFRNHEQTIYRTIHMTHSGTVERVSAEGSFLAAVIRSNRNEDSGSISFDNVYSIELWDTERGLPLAFPVDEVSWQPTGITLTDDGYFFYEGYNIPAVRILVRTECDASARSLFTDLSCYSLNRAQEPAQKIPAITEASMNWAQSVFTGKGEQENGSPSKISATPLEEIRSEKGADAWMERCNYIWRDIASGSLDVDLEDQIYFLKYCVDTAVQESKIDELDIAIHTVGIKNIIVAEDALNLIILDYVLEATEKFDIEIAQGYWDCANEELREATAVPESVDMEVLPVHQAIYRLYAYAFSGKWPGRQTYLDSIVGNREEVWESLREAGIACYADLLDGDADQAADDLNYYIRDYLYGAGLDRDEMTSSLTPHLWLMNLLRSRGLVTDSVVERFLERLSVNTGFQLRQVTWADLNTGFRLGDIITEINDTHILSNLHFLELLEKSAETKFTVMRNNKTLTFRKYSLQTPAGNFTVFFNDVV